MTIDEQVNYFMLGWIEGAERERCGIEAPRSGYSDDYMRGLNAGRAAYHTAERAERERLGQCSQCTGRGGWVNALDGLMQQCPTCHGTGRRA